MKNFMDFNEGLFSKKSSEDKKVDKLKDTLNALGQKSAGKGGWSAGEQEKYNKTWIEYRKLNDGKPPRGPKPGVYWDRMKGMSSYQHDALEQELHKKLGIK